MGAITAVLGQAGDQTLFSTLEKMLNCSPYRGKPLVYREEGLAIGVQVLREDAALAIQGRLIVAFHGYINNWSELDAKIKNHPSHSKDASSAEKLAFAFDVLGDQVFDLLRGEFATLIYDRNNACLVAARDIVGTKPLFFHNRQGRTLVASEIRQLLAGSQVSSVLNEEVMVDALLGRNVIREATLYRGVWRVLPAHIYRFTKCHSISQPTRYPYWLPPLRIEQAGDNTELAGELRRLLAKIIERTLPSEPFALALSGGLDSSTLWGFITALARAGDSKAALGRPYSMIFPGLSCDETKWIQATLRFTNTKIGVLLDCSKERPLTYHHDLVQRVDNPFGMTLYQLFIVGERTRADDRSIILCGVGADDWLQGSFLHLAEDLRSRYFLRCFKDAMRLQAYLPRGASRVWFIARAMGLRLGISRFFKPSPCPDWLHRSRHRKQVTPLHNEERLHVGRNPANAREDLMDSLYRLQTSTVLETPEQYAAAQGLELRYPFLDRDLIDFAFAIPPRAFTGGVRHKHLLRQAVQDLLAPVVQKRTWRTEFSDVLLPDQEELTRRQHERWSLVHRKILNTEGLDGLVGRVYAQNPTAVLELWHLYSMECLARRFGS